MSRLRRAGGSRIWADGATRGRFGRCRAGTHTVSGTPSVSPGLSGTGPGPDHLYVFRPRSRGRTAPRAADVGVRWSGPTRLPSGLESWQPRADTTCTGQTLCPLRSGAVPPGSPQCHQLPMSLPTYGAHNQLPLVSGWAMSLL